MFPGNQLTSGDGNLGRALAMPPGVCVACPDHKARGGKRSDRGYFTITPVLKKKRGRGMGSPIPSLQEGAWVREDPKVVGGG